MQSRKFAPADELEDLWHDFRRSLARRGRSLATIGVYRKSFETFWRWAESAGIAADPAAVDHNVINRWCDHMLTEPSMRNGRPVLAASVDGADPLPKLIEASTRRNRYANLRPFFTWHAKEFDCVNPFDRAEPPGEDRPTPIPVVALDDVRRLLATSTARDFIDVRDTALIRVLYDTGARLGELVALRVDSWDRRSDLLTLAGKTGTRVVPLAASTGEALSRYLRARKSHAHANRDALWLGPKGPLRDSGVAQLLKRRCDEAGVEAINPHRFRHTWAHAFRAEGGSEGDLMYLAGWSSTTMAHRYGRSAAAERAQLSMRRLALGDKL
jgi:site-specific recombinase XerD